MKTNTILNTLIGLLTLTILVFQACKKENEPSPPGGNDTFTDPRDGQTYNTVTIGSQTWFAENLNYETAVIVPQRVGSFNGDVYGQLYTWDAAMNACPDGWHLPGDDEWKALEMYLGMSQSEADDTGWRGTDEGKKLKSTNGWNNNGNGTDEVGFSAFPGGYRNFNGEIYDLGYNGHWWSATTNVTWHAWSRALGFGDDREGRINEDMGFGLSIRCVQD